MSQQYKFLRACITDEQLSDEIRRVKHKMNLNDEQLVQLALVKFVEENM